MTSVGALSCAGGMRRILSMCLFASALLAADISGNWRAKVETAAGSGTPSFILKQDGEKLKVIYKGRVKSATSKGGSLSIESLGDGSWTATKK